MYSESSEEADSTDESAAESEPEAPIVKTSVRAPSTRYAFFFLIAL